MEIITMASTAAEAIRRYVFDALVSVRPAVRRVLNWACYVAFFLLPVHRCYGRAGGLADAGVRRDWVRHDISALGLRYDHRATCSERLRARHEAMSLAVRRKSTVGTARRGC